MFSITKRYDDQIFSVTTRFTTTKMGPILIIQKHALGGKSVVNLS
jgi:hypothetical protein